MTLLLTRLARGPFMPSLQAAAALGLLVAAMTPHAQTVPQAPAAAANLGGAALIGAMAPFYIRGNGQIGQGFAIRNPKGKPNCLVVTAAHVARAGDRLTLVGLDSSTEQPTRLEVAATVFDDQNVAKDALVVLAPATDLPYCPELQVPPANTALVSSSFLRSAFVQPQTGATSMTVMVVVGGEGQRLRLRNVGTPVEPGFSGSLVAFNGQPLGVVQRIDGGEIEISRLDTARALIDRYGQATPAMATPKRTPWDTSFLPADFQKVHADALKTMSMAKVAQRVAQEEAKLAEEAAMRARHAVPGHTQVQDDTGVYEGQTDAQGAAVGLGVRRVVNGPGIGDVRLGRWKVTKREGSTWTSSLTGAGVIRSDDNADNQVRHGTFEGEVKEGSREGYGVLTFLDGDIVYTQWQKGGTNNAPMFYWRKQDGFVFSGTAVDGRWGGKGVMWDAVGQVYLVGVWKNGSLEQNLSSTLLAR